jgi:mannose-6-phosphate isomerase-like protein (cupin superfamily)
MSPSWSPARAQGWPQATHPFPVGASLPDEELELKKLIYAYWNESLKEGGGDFNYQEAFQKMAPFLKKKLAEHGILTKSDFIEAEMDYIRRRRYNELHPEEKLPLTPLGGDMPRYFGEDNDVYQSYGEKKRLIEEAKDLPAYMNPDEMPGKPGLWADDFRVVRRKYLGTVGSSGVANMLAEGTMIGRINTEKKPKDYLSYHEAERALAQQYQDELQERPLQQDELNYLWDRIYDTNRDAHIRMDTFKEDLLPIYKDIEKAQKGGYKDKLKNMALFDSLIHAQHVTGSLLPVDVNQLRDDYNRQRAANVRIAKRIDRYAGKKPDKGPWVGDIEKETLDNENFRKVVHTGDHEQLVFMKLKPSEDIGDEVHPHTDQFIRVEEGKGKVIFNEKNAHPLNNGDATVITAGTWHNIINASDKKPLKLYTVYAPPHHKPGTIQKDKPTGD